MIGQRNRRYAFTIVELLVVIAVIGILIGILLPATHAARESGRRIQCVDNLRQLGVAIQNYESARRRLPPGYRSHSRQSPPPPTRDPQTWDAPPGWGWGAYLLALS